MDYYIYDPDDSSLDYRERSEFLRKIELVREDDPSCDSLTWYEDNPFLNSLTDENWVTFGRYISNNTHLINLDFSGGVVNDGRMSSLFQGLTRSSSIRNLSFYQNGLSAAGLRSMAPFLHNSNLRSLLLMSNNIRSEGFNFLLRALHDSSLECLNCSNCNIETLEIDSDHLPRNLTELFIDDNSLNADGCRELSKLLQGRDSILKELYLDRNKIDDEGVAILVDALRNNTTLTKLTLRYNDEISREGQIMLLKLVNDISTIKATLQSNHTLENICVDDVEDMKRIKWYIDSAISHNQSNKNNPRKAGVEKVRHFQLDCRNRLELEELQNIQPSFHSQINPLHLPEMLSLVGCESEVTKLYFLLRTSVAEVISIVNRRKYVEEQRAYHTAKLKEFDAQLAVMDAAEAEFERYNSRTRKRQKT